jgi:hypothetical protein
VKGKVVPVFEGVMFAVGVLMVVVPSYFLFIEHFRQAKR